MPGVLPILTGNYKGDRRLHNMGLDAIKEEIIESINKWDSRIIKFIYYFLVEMNVIKRKGY